jgi:hypothetical protein
MKETSEKLKYQKTGMSTYIRAKVCYKYDQVSGIQSLLKTCRQHWLWRLNRKMERVKNGAGNNWP